jgi:hypothetical protein
MLLTPFKGSLANKFYFTILCPEHKKGIKSIPDEPEPVKKKIKFVAETEKNEKP